MAFKNGLSERLDELRFPSPRSPPSESPFPGYSSISPGHANFVSAFSRPSGDVRANLQRRFTTDSSKLSSWSYLNNLGGAPQVPDPLDLLSSVSFDVSVMAFVEHICRFWASATGLPVILRTARTLVALYSPNPYSGRKIFSPKSSLSEYTLIQSTHSQLISHPV